jgi:starch-binding outer membrane protein SusE/F
MKNTFKLLLATVLFSGLWSCEDEQDLMILTPPASFQILTPDAGTAVELTPGLQDNPALTVTWAAADYENPTAITYDVEVSKSGNDFETFIVAGSTSNTNITWSVLELNAAAGAAGLTPFVEEGLDIRIKSTTGTADAQAVYSNVVTVLLKTFTTELPKIAVPGNHQGWNPPTAPRLAASGFGLTDYDGYLWLDGGYKFVGPDGSGNFNWGNTDWGDDGSFSGGLAETGESDCTATAGYYRVQANTSTLIYSTTPTVWGIVGAATPGGWDNSTALTYNFTSKKWEGIVVLTAGEFKFRANNAWTLNFGGDPAQMSYDGSNLSVDAGGTYLVALDLSNPRVYSYTLTAQ